MGFNNEGSEAVAARLAKQPPPGSAPDSARGESGQIEGRRRSSRRPADYLASFRRLADYADYLVLNVSSPNTPNLRQLQDESRLRELLGAVTTRIATARRSRENAACRSC